MSDRSRKKADVPVDDAKRKKTKVRRIEKSGSSTTISSLQAATSWEPPSVVLSVRDKAKQIEISSDQLVCVGHEGGYRMVRATHGVHSGTYYFEAEILMPEENDADAAQQCHVRIGWSTRDGELQSYVGYDSCSYGIRDTAGSILHGGNRFDGYAADVEGGAAFGPGDIIGCYLHLDEHAPVCNHIRYYRNGVDLGVAFCNSAQLETTTSFPPCEVLNKRGVQAGSGSSSAPTGRGSAAAVPWTIPSAIYYPAVSLYMRAAVRMNFGPSFIIKPASAFSANSLLRGWGACMAMSEVQPMSPTSRKIHERNIASIQQQKHIANGKMPSSKVILRRDDCMDTRQIELDESA